MSVLDDFEYELLHFGKYADAESALRAFWFDKSPENEARAMTYIAALMKAVGQPFKEVMARLDRIRGWPDEKNIRWP